MSESQQDLLVGGQEKAKAQCGEAGSAPWGGGPAGLEGEVTPAFCPGDPVQGRCSLDHRSLRGQHLGEILWTQRV